MFLLQEDNDKLELRRHIYANGVDRHTIRRLLQKVFVPCSCAKLREKNVNHRCPGHEVAIPIDETVAALDISEETISTLLCYLELHPKRFITVLSSVYVRARVSSYNGPQGLKQAAQSVIKCHKLFLIGRFYLFNITKRTKYFMNLLVTTSSDGDSIGFAKRHFTRKRQRY